MKKLFNYFMNGLLLVLPLAATALLLAYVIIKIDSIVPVPVPGLGLVIVVAGVTFIGYIGRNILVQPLVKLIEQGLGRIPLISVIYKSTRDFAEAFLGNERKFENPILYDANGDGTYRVGFLTQESLDHIGLADYVGVYIPHSYNFSGNFYMVPRSRIRPLKISTSQAMRFAVTGGVVNLDKKVPGSPP
jgi:uncharacterized membrane protein